VDVEVPTVPGWDLMDLARSWAGIGPWPAIDMCPSSFDASQAELEN